MLMLGLRLSDMGSSSTAPFMWQADDPLSITREIAPVVGLSLKKSKKMPVTSNYNTSVKCSGILAVHSTIGIIRIRTEEMSL